MVVFVETYIPKLYNYYIEVLLARQIFFNGNGGSTHLKLVIFLYYFYGRGECDGINRINNFKAF